MKQLYLLFTAMFFILSFANAQITIFPYFENFDNYTSNGPYQCASTVTLNSGWSNETSVTEGTNNGDWSNYSWSTPTTGTGPTTDHTGNGGYFLFTSSFSCFNSYRHLRSPTFDFTNLSHPQLSFWYFAYGRDIGTMTLEVSSDGGTTWSETFFAVTENEGNFWKQAIVNLCAYGGQSAVMFRFVALTGSTRYSDFAIDDVGISNVPPVGCAPVSGVRVASTNGTDAVIQWSDECAMNYNWEVVPYGNAQGTGVLQSGNTASTQAALTNLTPLTAYHVFVKTFCSTDSSNYAGPFLIMSGCNGALSGTYQIGGNTPNFTTINAAINSLVSCGISSSVVFDVAPGIYKENLNIPFITGTTSTNTVTFKGQDVATTIIEHDSLSATVQNSTILLDKAEYVTFKHLTIKNTDNIADPWGIHLFDDALYTTIDSCWIVMDTILTASMSYDNSTGIISTDDNGPHSNPAKDNASHTLIQNTRFVGGAIAVLFDGYSTTLTNRNTNNQVVNCQMEGVYDIGVRMNLQESPIASNNRITFSTTGAGVGVSIAQSKEPTITSNLIINAGDNGIALYSNNSVDMSPVNAVDVSNNMVTAINQGFAFTLFGNRMVDFYYNTGHASTYTFVSSGDHSTDNIKNNIFSVDANSTTMMILNGTLTASSTAFDYNIYNHPSNTNLVKIGTITYSDLAGWNGLTPLNNNNSLLGNPIFYSNNDLHLQGLIADSTAVVIPSITVDIDGEARDPLFPDIGADEYTPPTCQPPADLNASSITGLSAVLEWMSSGSPTVWEIEYDITGFMIGTGTVIQVTTDSFMLNNLVQTTDYSYRVRSICGVGDTSFWSGLYSFTTNCDINVPTILPFTEDFENTTNITLNDNGLAHCSATNSWSFETNEVNARMFLGTNAPITNGGNGALLMDKGMATGNTNNAAVFTLNMSNYTGMDNIELSFDIRNDNLGSNSSNNKIWIRGSVSDDWVELYDWRLVNTTMTFVTVNHLDIDKTLANAGQSLSNTFQIKIGQGNTGQYPGSGTFFDNLTLDTVICSQPLLLGTDYIGTTNANLVWSEGGSATSWEVEWGLVNFTLGNGTLVTNLTDTTLSLSGLLKDREYDFYVRANCGGDNSNWVGPYTFRTMCDVFSFFPFTETFTPNNGTVNCWRTSAEKGLSTWEFGTLNGLSLNGSAMAYFNDAAQGDGNDNKVILYSPIFNMQGLDTAFMSFTYNFDSYEYNEYFRTEVWDGSSWNTVLNIDVDDCGQWFNCTYTTVQIDLTPYTNSELQVRFTYDDGNHGNWYSSSVGIDNFVVNGQYDYDVMVTAGAASFCSTTETITIDFQNNGVNTLTSIPLSYVVNSNAPVTETWTGILHPGVTAQYTFATTFDGSSPITYNISAYSSLPNDGNLSNDLTNWTVDATPNYTAPFTENFNNFTSADWTTSATISQGAQGMSSPAAWVNLFNLFKKVEINTPRIGNIAMGDELRFNYRYVDFPNGLTPTQLGNGDTLTVEVSTDCGVTYTTIGKIHSGNHTSTTNYTGVNYDLSAFVGEAIVVKITAEREFSGDYFIEVDDIYIGPAVSLAVNVTSDYNGFDVSCINTSDGIVTVTTTGIATPISVVWSDGSTAMTANNLSTGKHFVTVTDVNGFDFTRDFELNAPNLPTSMITVTSDYNGAEISCNDGNDGAATVTAIGGISGYTYQWDANAASQTGSTAVNLSADTFTVIITDGNGCQISDTVTLVEPTAIIPSLSSQPDIDSAGVGSVIATAQGGTPPYSYQWDANAGNATTDLVNNLGVGNYSVTITDANGCTATDTVNIDFLSDIVDVFDMVTTLKITPNPTQANVLIEFSLKERATIDLKIYNINGQLIRDLGERVTQNTVFMTDLSDLANGVYLVRIRVDNTIMTRRIILNK